MPAPRLDAQVYPKLDKLAAFYRRDSQRYRDVLTGGPLLEGNPHESRGLGRFDGEQHPTRSALHAEPDDRLFPVQERGSLLLEVRPLPVVPVCSPVTFGLLRQIPGAPCLYNLSLSCGGLAPREFGLRLGSVRGSPR